MPIRDEKTFTDEEFIAAFSIILPPDEAHREGLAWNAFPDPKGFEYATSDELRASEFKSHRSYDGDLLDLLSLVSDSCAERAWRLMGITYGEGEHRRAEFRRRINDAVRARDSSAS
ncbi:hypothetical protein [Longimicrobium sp.]|jgi:hypothetical protein|uniref:hypothetical protein n=1 Tax=Longimicrobium sp. TaxID=2029185 RepID=UPI002EDACF97